MRIIKSLATGFILMICLIGCGKKSALEGKVVDGKGQPVASIKIIAKQIQPIKGYEQFEATSSSDGGFKFGKLFPNSEYELVAHTDKYLTEPSRIKVESGPEGQTRLLPTPLELRFATPKEGVVLDTKTGLMWARDANIADRKMNWFEAMTWAQQLNYAGYSDWRLPSKEELETLVDNRGKSLKEFANVQPDGYWSSTSNFAYSAWVLSIYYGHMVDINKTASVLCVWPVRGGR